MQPPQPQVFEHVAVPFPSHGSVACGAQTPCPVQAEKPDQVPLLHVCVSVPQFPHGFDVTSQLEPHATSGVVQVTPHFVPSHVAAPLAGTGQAAHELPQLFRELLETQAPLQACSPVEQVQPPHVHVLVHVAVPLPSQASVAFGAHTPAPVHADQADQVPNVPLQVRVCVPQLPHAWVPVCVGPQTPPHFPAIQD
jgi:hypothetical protein